MTEKNTSVVEKKKEVAAAASVSGFKPEKNDDRRSKKGRRGGNKRRRREPKEFEEAILQVRRVTRVTKGGRQLRFSVSVVIGDQKGRVGFANGKSSEVMLGVQKAIATAKKKLIKVPIFEDSIPHAVVSKYKASQVYLFPAQEGKGVIAGSSVRKILELAGIKNVLSKMHGSRNKINAAYATIEALKQLQNRSPKRVVKEEEEEKAVVEEVKETKKIEKKVEKKASAEKSTKK
ncbi:30S ribosomal protein S5 [Candidatus Gracilibacteria bacterium]|nr:30S ribosomal protein S5 [Candidatus Gracilibacteria bacterium]